MGRFLMLLAMLVLLDSILQMQLFQINQSEESSKITINAHTTSGQLHQQSITSAVSSILQTHAKCSQVINWLATLFCVLLGVGITWADCSQ